MKQKLIKCLVAALAAGFVICLAGCLANHFAFEQTGHFRFAFQQYGGECMMEHGFGMRAFHIYPMIISEEDALAASVREWFSPVDFGIWWFAVSGILFLFLAVVTAVRNRLGKGRMSDGKKAGV